jgi:hypothetical protein
MGGVAGGWIDAARSGIVLQRLKSAGYQASRHPFEFGLMPVPCKSRERYI